MEQGGILLGSPLGGYFLGPVVVVGVVTATVVVFP